MKVCSRRQIENLRKLRSIRRLLLPSSARRAGDRKLSLGGPFNLNLPTRLSRYVNFLYYIWTLTDWKATEQVIFFEVNTNHSGDTAESHSMSVRWSPGLANRPSLPQQGQGTAWAFPPPLILTLESPLGKCTKQIIIHSAYARNFPFWVLSVAGFWHYWTVKGKFKNHWATGLLDCSFGLSCRTQKLSDSEKLFDFQWSLQVSVVACR